ncbi:putative molybdenum carrier protein [Thioalkalivibrio sp. ALE11]|uniref:putative molybdenum carrier protein n=1 Tax=Thioalkalivibrio sp. ALE11 TaxID=1265494 RepID=UPI0009D99624|nr:putative molybdenum carrier protein [Thioalkalivibrio sp. ALE11]
MLSKIVSGGQTGVDRAALDVARDLGVPCGGWCPADRCAEDGVIPERYPVDPLATGGRHKRTEWNVRDSDGTLILTIGALTGGSLLTRNLARKHKKPYLIVDLDSSFGSPEIGLWVASECIETLNVAGPSESTCPGIEARAYRFLHHLVSWRIAASSCSREW